MSNVDWDYFCLEMYRKTKKALYKTKEPAVREHFRRVLEIYKQD